MTTPDRAILFIDGNNWYHSLRNAGLNEVGRLDYARVSEKLIGPSRKWVGTRYYIGQVRQQSQPTLYAEQRRFLARLTNRDNRITVHLGRLEPRSVDNPAAYELSAYLGSLTTPIDSTVYRDLFELANRHRVVETQSEKAVDVMLAVDMVQMAMRDEYDAGYILSADGDYTPVAAAVHALGKKVYAASPAYGAQLAAKVKSFIRLTPSWFNDCV